MSSAVIAKPASFAISRTASESAADTNAALAIAKEAGFAITAEDIQSMDSATSLSDEELEGVAGGYGGSGALTSCDGQCVPYW